MSIVQKVHLLNSSYLASLNAAWLTPLTRWLVGSPENWFVALFTKSCTFLLFLLSFKCIAYDFFSSKMHLYCNTHGATTFEVQRRHMETLAWPKDNWINNRNTDWANIFLISLQNLLSFSVIFPFLASQKSDENRQNATNYCTWSDVFQQPNAKAQLIKWSLAHCPQKNPTCWPRTINWGSFFAGMLVCLKNYWQSGYNQLILWVRSCVWVNQVEVH